MEGLVIILCKIKICDSFNRLCNEPIIIPIVNISRSLKIDLHTSSWTPKMFYELPYIKVMVKNINNSEFNNDYKIVPTYNPILIDSDFESIFSFTVDVDIGYYYMYLYPIYDNNSVYCNKELLFFDGEYSPTVVFDLILEVLN